MLYQPDTDILFPARVIPSLRHLRGKEWANFIDQLSQHTNETHIDILAFSYLMIHISSCITCHADSFRALRGCTICARQTISRYKGSDSELIGRWQKLKEEIQLWLDKNPNIVQSVQALAFDKFDSASSQTASAGK